MRHLYAKLGLFAALAAGLLAACDDAPQTNVTFRLEDVWSFAQGAMTRGPLPVDVRGAPYAEDGAATEKAVIDAMTQAITWTANPRFSVAAETAAPPAFRVIVTLNGGGGLGGRDQCLGQSSGGGPLPDGEVRVVATFCEGDDVLANVRGQVKRTDGRGDARFSRLIRQITRDMFISSHDP